MRDYAKIGPQFWIGDTGKALRGHPEAQVLAAYLISCPHANMIGMYYLPMNFLVHETGLTAQGASKALQRLIEGGFCAYDDASEVVWVIEMAKFQIGAGLSPNDKQCKGIQREYEAIPNNKNLRGFFERYRHAFHMTHCRGDDSPFEAPSKPHRSQEQEQEQEQEQDLAPDVSPSVRRGNVAWSESAGFTIPPKQLEAWKLAFPAINVEQKIAAAHAWAIANPKNRKKNWAGFLHRWLTNDQDRAPVNRQKPDEPRRVAI